MKRERISLCFFTMIYLVHGVGACGKKSNSDSPAPDSSANPALDPVVDNGSGSAVDDPAAQKLLTTEQVNNALAALSDGGTGSSESINSSEFVDSALTAFAETRSCSVTPLSAAATMSGADGSTWTLPSGTPTVTVKRTSTGTIGNRTYNTVTGGGASGETEVWYPGPYFGLKNITSENSSANYGVVPVPSSGNAVPAIPSPSSTAAAGSSGKLGSVGWRSLDGSWTGAPVWEVGTGFVGTGPLAATQTKGMVMYYTTNMPTVTAATTAPKVGGTYAPLVMLKASDKTASKYSVLGQYGSSALPSFQAGGFAVINDTLTAVNQAGTLTSAGLPVRIYNPPTEITCDSAGKNTNPGWRFSQNMAGLTKVTTINRNVTTTYAKGSNNSTLTGKHTITWSDPALVAPVSNTPSAPYFDQNAGTITMTRTTQIGSPTSPNTNVFTFTPTKGTVKPTVTNSSYTSTALTETLTRNLLSDWQWVTKTIASGTINTSHVIGTGAAVANIATTFYKVTFNYNSDKAVACIPNSGAITTVITPVDTTKQTTTVAVKFGTSEGITPVSGVSVTITCSGGTTGAKNCTAVSEMDDSDYKPQGCNF